jgi:hypothetical protein
LPEDPEALWTFIYELAEAERLELLAHCVSLTANAIAVAQSRLTEPGLAACRG